MVQIQAMLAGPASGRYEASYRVPGPASERYEASYRMPGPASGRYEASYKRVSKQTKKRSENTEARCVLKTWSHGPDHNNPIKSPCM